MEFSVLSSFYQLWLFIFCDREKDFPVFPETITRLCIIHQIRNSLTYIASKDWKAVAADLKPIDTARTEDEALFAHEELAEKWDQKYPIIWKSWKANWSKINPMFGFPAEIRRAIYPTNVIESLNTHCGKSRKPVPPFHPKKPPSNFYGSDCKISRKNGQCRFRLPLLAIIETIVEITSSYCLKIFLPVSLSKC